MRKKKILLTFSKNRNRKVYSYTFNIYCAYWLLQYKAMILLKCSSQDGTVSGLAGFRPGGHSRVAVCNPVSSAPGAQDQGQLGPWTGKEPREVKQQLLAFLGGLLLGSSWWHHQAGGRPGTRETGHASPGGLCTAETHRGGCWVHELRDELHRDVGHPLSSVQIQGEGLEGRWGPLTLPPRREDPASSPSSAPCPPEAAARILVSPRPAEKTLVSISEEK